MRKWFDGGAGGSGATPGDAGADPAAVAAPEVNAGAGGEPAAGDASQTAQEQADQARNEMIARVAAETAQRVVQEWAGRQPAPNAPAAPPPTASTGVIAALEAEGAAIAQEDARLRAAITRDGLTAQNLYDQNELTRREARFVARVTLAGQQETERRAAIDSRSAKDDDAYAKDFKAYAALHPNVDPDILRDAFRTKWDREHPAKAPAAPPPAAPGPNGRSVVNVSAPSEVTAAQVRARTMTREHANQHRANLRAEGRDGEAAAFDRDIRNGKVLVKG